MALKVFFRPQAEADLFALYEYIAHRVGCCAPGWRLSPSRMVAGSLRKQLIRSTATKLYAVIKRADPVLYRAKRDGRNRAVPDVA